MESVPADGRCLPSQQPKPFEGRHDLLSDMGPMVAPLGSSVSTLESRMSLFGFHWMLQISAGSSYAVATAMIVFGLFTIASNARRVAPLLVASGLVAAIAALRAQLFIVMALAWIPLF